jgi:crotonobetainyl-CoA:carnitine CoA-transferase CaiB-like acyl-CoA transferase
MSELFERGTLGGLRVLEIGTSVAAPMAAQILGDLGAEVIKIERVGRGDDSRSWAPPHWSGVSVTFLSLNRNKKSIALDFKDVRGAAILAQLVQGADVLIQNLRPGALAAAGFSAERIRELNPGIIYCEMTGFGGSGPRADQPAYDPLLQAYSGIVSITGEEGGPPARVPVSLLDMGTGMWTALAVYEALRRREQTGQGSHVELSLLQTALTWLTMPLMAVLSGAAPPVRMGSGLAGVVPYGAFPTRDGYVFVSAGNDQLWARLCQALDAPQLSERPEFASNEDRVQHRAAVTTELSDTTRQFDSTELLRRLNEARVPCSPVQTLDQVLADEQVRATGLVTPVSHERIPDFSVINLPVTFDGSYPSHFTPPPAVGANTTEVLTALGMDAEEIARLRHDGVIGSPTPEI